MKKLATLLIVLFAFTITVFSQTDKFIKEKRYAEREGQSLTRHSLALPNGKSLNYTARAGYTYLKKEEEGKIGAKIFFVAYTKDGVKDPAERPLTFAFNGGPGSSSVWLHMGALGPKRVLMTDKGDATPPPYKVVDNEYSWLEFTDLVFIDPVMTGYSRTVDSTDKKEFTGFVKDIESVGEFIRIYTSKYERWNSPKYLAGESYGTTRACGLAGHLQDRYGLYLNGLVLISQITNFQTARFEIGNDLPYPLFLPTYAATAWYHKKLDPSFNDLNKLLIEVEAFSLNEYTVALTKGDALSEKEKNNIADKLSEYTGLSKKYILQANLRPVIHRFVKELRRDEGLTVGRLDSRFTGVDYDGTRERYEFDPSYSKAIYGPFSMAVNDHLSRFLEYKSELPYEILTGRVRPWSYSNVENKYLNVSETLRQAMHKNPHLKVLICNGYYDLATPYFATKYTVGHMFLDENLKDNIILKYYEAGHMMYIRKPSLVKMAGDVRGFYLGN
ncbi:MAG TPA: peptidase S10 [Bacteroidetes bacterium]|nr:peptidase S10 [Bacteroidota bacterium]